MNRVDKLIVAVEKKKAVLLDLDNTLYAYTPCHNQALARSSAFYRENIEPIPHRVFLKYYAQARAHIHRTLKGQAASHSRLLYFQTLLEKRTGRTCLEWTLRLEKLYWDTFLVHMRLYAWVKPVLDYCRGNNIRVVIVTNLTAAIQHRKLRHLKLHKHIDFLVSSEEAGLEKPAPIIFKIALAKAGCTAAQAVLIGDDSKQDRHLRMDRVIL